MRYASVASAIALLVALPAAPLRAAAANGPEFLTRTEVMEWIDGYRHKPAPARVPDAVKALSRFGALRDPEASGFYVGFVAGVLGTHPYDAERLVGQMLPLPPGDQWFLVRTLAYSGLPSWKSLLRRTAERLPAKRGMANAYLDGTLPTLDAVELDKDPTFLERLGEPLGLKPKPPTVSFGGNPELVDTLWGQYFATSEHRPISRIIALLPWSKERDNGERLAVGSAAKYTLANNAARYPDILALIKEMESFQGSEIRPILADVVHAAETTDTAGIRKAQLAMVDKLKSKGPGYQRDMKVWGYVAQGAIGVTCVVLATISLSAAGLPCVIGGAASSAALNYYAGQ
jgi:hypothetical protein